MTITYDPDKRDRTLRDRGLDFAALTVEIEDTRKDYGEKRIICYGQLEGRLIVISYTPSGADRHIYSMRKANHCGQVRLASFFGL